jgi:hypothetical protein
MTFTLDLEYWMLVIGYRAFHRVSVVTVLP